MRVQINTTTSLTIPFHALPLGDVFVHPETPEDIWMKVVGDQAVNIKTGYIYTPYPHKAVNRREAIATVS